MRIHSAIVPLVAAALAVASLSMTPITTSAAFPGGDGRIVFVDIQDGAGAGAVIFSMSKLGEDVQH